MGLVSMLLLAAGLGGCRPVERFDEFTGDTMGTYFRVRYVPAQCQPEVAAVSARLAQINALMSTYDPDSQLSRFNAATSIDPVIIDPELVSVLEAGLALWRDSQGAFDVTSGPLVNLWGFGAGQAVQVPTVAEQAQARALVGSDQLTLRGGQLSKAQAQVYVDLSAIAKGYAVDVVADMLRTQGCERLMVDIGGEMRLHGDSPRGGAWRIGIESPQPGAIGQLHQVLALRDLALATSGDYRNFRMIDGRRVDHLMDPRAGGPATSRIASATVLHTQALWADGYATTVMVLGEEAAMAFAERHEFALYLIIHDGSDAGFRTRYNAHMARYLAQTEG
ncbi:MAG: FAD:protein FMN transferase [Pseudomonadota bacterium]